MSSRSNQPIAKRHESFPASAVLPGEDRKEFEALFDDLWRDLKPSGPVEGALVADVASLVWRKQHLSVFQAAQAARREFGECFADGDVEAGAFRASQQRMEREQRNLERRVKEAEFIEEIKPQFVAFSAAIQKIEKSAHDLLKQNGIEPASRPEPEQAAAQELAKQREAYQYAILSDLITPDCFIQELEFKERLDKAIKHALDRLAKYQARRISGSTVDRRRPRRGRAR